MLQKRGGRSNEKKKKLLVRSYSEFNESIPSKVRFNGNLTPARIDCVRYKRTRPLETPLEAR